jgi:hypothetical protein
MARRLSEIKEAIFTGSLRRQHANYFGFGSILDGFATDLANLIFELESNQENLLGANHLDTVSADQLLRFAKDFNITPEVARRAYSLESDSNVIISTTNGQSLDSVFLENDIILPGLRVSDGDRSKIYVIEGTTADTSINTSCFVTVRALEIGAGLNVQKNELTRLEKPYKSLRITNNFAIANGSNNESNAALKDRILYKIESNLRNKNILTAILTRVPGYGKSSIVQNYDGPNTMLVCVQPASGLYFPSSALDDIKNTLLMYLPSGTRIIVKNFDPVAFSIKTQIVATNSNTAANLVEPVKAAITRYFDGLGGGESVDLKRLAVNILAEIPGVKLISRIGNSFQEVSYSVYEGTSKLSYMASGDETVNINSNQIGTLESLIVNYE